MKERQGWTAGDGSVCRGWIHRLLACASPLALYGRTGLSSIYDFCRLFFLDSSLGARDYPAQASRCLDDDPEFRYEDVCPFSHVSRDVTFCGSHLYFSAFTFLHVRHPGMVLQVRFECGEGGAPAGLGWGGDCRVAWVAGRSQTPVSSWPSYSAGHQVTRSKAPLPAVPPVSQALPPRSEAERPTLSG